ncbi:MAG: SpoIIE family protein phosphatase [Candidatus Ozemobacteraceae bacterium]
MIAEPYFIEIGHHQKAKAGEYSFGDVILKRFIKEENRRIVVLADGMGSGIKANILANLTASMALNFICEHKSIVEASALIFNILPECSVRKMAYSTFTIVDMVGDGTTHLIVYDNPLPVVLRHGEALKQEWRIIELSETPYAGKSISTASFMPEQEDRLLVFSDGISQSGLGRSSEWRREGVIAFALKSVQEKPDFSAGDLSEKIVHKAEMNDKIGLKDDATFFSVYFRKPRRLLIATGAPVSRERDFAFARRFREFPGKKVVAGGTTSEVIARELDLKFSANMISLNDGLPPISMLESADLVTEGVMTLDRVERLLGENGREPLGRDGAAERMTKLILNADLIEFCVGTAANEFHYNLQCKLRVQLIKDIAELLETKHMKQTTIEFF